MWHNHWALSWKIFCYCDIISSAEVYGCFEYPFPSRKYTALASQRNILYLNVHRWKLNIVPFIAKMFIEKPKYEGKEPSHYNFKNVANDFGGSLAFAMKILRITKVIRLKSYKDFCMISWDLYLQLCLVKVPHAEFLPDLQLCNIYFM